MANLLIIDSRSFVEYNDAHITGAVNVCCAKMFKRRLQQDKISVKEYLQKVCQIDVDESWEIIVYDQSSTDSTILAPDSFLHVLITKLARVFQLVGLLRGGYLEFQGKYPELCDESMGKYYSGLLGSLSQPCLPVTNVGPTRILPFLYLGSQQDAMNKELLMSYNINYIVNVSTSGDQPDFIQDSHFLRIPVNDNYNDRLAPHLNRAFEFLDKVEEASGNVLVHCLMGISRSPSVAIAYIMMKQGLSWEEAYRIVKSKRATISPNFNFLGQLMEFERHLQRENKLKRPSNPIPSTPSCGVPRSLSLSFAPSTAVPATPSVGDMSPTTALAKLSFDQFLDNGKNSFTSTTSPSLRKGEKRTLDSRACSSMTMHHSSITVTRNSMDSSQGRNISVEISFNKKFQQENEEMVDAAATSPSSMPPEEKSRRVEVHIDRVPASNLKERSFSPRQSKSDSRISVTGYPLGRSGVHIHVGPSRTSSTGCFGRRLQPEEPLLEDDGDEGFVRHLSNSTWFVPTPDSMGYPCARSDSVSTSGLGSEAGSDFESICDSAGSGAASVVMDPDDGVFPDWTSLGPSPSTSSSSISKAPIRPSSLLSSFSLAASGKKSVEHRIPITMEGEEDMKEREKESQEEEESFSLRNHPLLYGQHRRIQSKDSAYFSLQDVEEAQERIHSKDLFPSVSDCDERQDSGIGLLSPWSSADGKLPSSEDAGVIPGMDVFQNMDTLRPQGKKAFDFQRDLDILEKKAKEEFAEIRQDLTRLMGKQKMETSTWKRNSPTEPPSPSGLHLILPAAAVVPVDPSKCDATVRGSLYRVQSCPGMVSNSPEPPLTRKSLISSPETQAAAWRPSGAVAPLSRLDKFKNRYSCGSLDNEIVSVLGESCPDIVQWRGCQQVASESPHSSNSSLSNKSHRPPSIIEVS
ncbi:unnamed protein product [Darwinula stevensoni]|uniref:protein-tyrosine-phosphatase n=1 Tax=Darwinula stevensoni TaxID=69355 RepID=A0A7R9FSP5_9CRUS|nr:unnamed protein product [Darwinula stevensoni]CAG0904213.1 unnamed protein product [Darwinula stevensoni]